jgi:adenylate cyclase
MIEIERKFLVKNNDFKRMSLAERRITQGYLSTDPERSVRIRCEDDKGYITIKGTGNKSGTSRFEWEREIDLKETLELLHLCKDGIIDKTRFEVNHEQHIFEVDVFHDVNEGLIIAEIELEHEDEPFSKPHWLGEEVTGDLRYYNASLSLMPYSEWE